MRRMGWMPAPRILDSAFHEAGPLFAGKARVRRAGRGHGGVRPRPARPRLASSGGGHRRQRLQPETVDDQCRAGGCPFRRNPDPGFRDASEHLAEHGSGTVPWNCRPAI